MNLPLPPASSWPNPAQQPPAPPQPALAPYRPAPRRGWVRWLVNLAVAIVVIAVAGAAFVFSYSGVHAVALLGGMSPRLARYYPAVFDALLVVACVAAVVLRDGRWWARLWAWLVVVVVLAAIGWVDVIHAINYGLEHRPTEGAVAAAPVVAVLLAFSLLLTMLRQSKPRPNGAGRADGPEAPLGGRARRELEDGPDTENMPTILLPAVSAPAVSAPAISSGPVLDGPVLEGPVFDGPVSESTVPAEVVATRADYPVLTRSAETAAEPDEPDGPDEPAAGGAFAEADTPSARTRPIRYASRSAREEPDPGYWDSENDPELAGQVYPPRDADPDEPYEPGSQQAPADPDGPRFTTVPRLNRARVTPTPPADDAD